VYCTVIDTVGHKEIISLICSFVTNIIIIIIVINVLIIVKLSLQCYWHVTRSE